MKLSFIAVLFIHFLLFVLSTDARRIKGIRKRNLQTTMSPGKGKRKGSDCNTGKGTGKSSSSSSPGKGKNKGKENKKGSSTSSPGKGKGNKSTPCDPGVPPPTTAPTPRPTVSNDDRNLKEYQDTTHSNKHNVFRGSV